MELSFLKDHLLAYRSHNQILDAADFIVDQFDLSHENFSSFELQEIENPKILLLTAVGEIGGKQKITLPRNLLDFDLDLVINMLAHEMLHVKQKAPESPVRDKNEREWCAYYEMLFHKEFPKVPDTKDFYRIQFATKAMEYYRRMGEGSPLQAKYKEEMKQVKELLCDLLEKQSTFSLNKKVIPDTPPLGAPNNLPREEESPDQKHISDDAP